MLLCQVRFSSVVMLQSLLDCRILAPVHTPDLFANHSNARRTLAQSLDHCLKATHTTQSSVVMQLHVYTVIFCTILDIP